MMRLWKRLGRQHWVQKAIGVTAAEYLRFVAKTNRVVFEPSDIYENISSDLPVIIAMWHGQHALMPFIKRPEHRAKVLISHHRDGEINAIAAQRLGVEIIRGSGDHGGGFNRKGGVSAFRQMLAALDEGYSMATTADVPKISRVAGLGIVKLAQLSGRPIVPVALATSLRIELNNWDRSVINLPFGRGAGVGGTLIRVAADADGVALETARQAVEQGLNAVTARAQALVGRSGDAPRG
jgi:lysophospholipid acyltransferase (LPLAT)-like uncharacterized protein